MRLSSAVCFALSLGAVSSASAAVVDVGTHTIPYSNNARGFWFEAPTALCINNISVPTNASSNAYDAAIILMDADPPAYAATTTVTPAFTITGVSGTTTTSVGLSVPSGKRVGVFGSRTNVTSYGSGSGPYSSSVAGMPVTLKRFIVQPPLSTWIASPTMGVSADSGSIGRVLIDVSAGACSSTPVSAPIDFNFNKPVETTPTEIELR